MTIDSKGAVKIKAGQTWLRRRDTGHVALVTRVDEIETHYKGDEAHGFVKNHRLHDLFEAFATSRTLLSLPAPRRRRDADELQGRR